MIAKKRYAFTPDYATPPGVTLEETMHALGMTQKELFERTGLTVVSLNRIFKGEQPVTPETAAKLELVTGTPASLWNNLESQYRAYLASVAERERLQAHIAWLKSIPVAELIKRKMIKPMEDAVNQLREVLAFFGVADVENWQKIWRQPAASARRSTFFDSAPGPTAAWLRIGQIRARDITCAPYDAKRFATNLAIIRTFTNRSPDSFLPEVRRLCAEAGVAFVLVPELDKAPWSGAAEWLTPDKAMIVLSLRGKREDKFWFTFFHEAAHILHDSKKETHIDDGKPYEDNPVEQRADAYAADMLIPASFNVAIAAASSEAALRDLAGRIGVAPGIVAGRHGFLTGKWARFAKVPRSYVWRTEKAVA